MYAKPDLFTGPCAASGRCAELLEDRCIHAVVRSTAGDWFITFGHAGFNLPANNRFGYRTEQSARAAILRLVSKPAPVRPITFCGCGFRTDDRGARYFHKPGCPLGVKVAR